LNESATAAAFSLALGEVRVTVVAKTGVEPVAKPMIAHTSAMKYVSGVILSHQRNRVPQQYLIKLFGALMQFLPQESG